MRNWIKIVTEGLDNPHEQAAMLVAQDDALFEAIREYVVNFESGIGDPDDSTFRDQFTAILRSLPAARLRVGRVWRGECRSSWREKFGRGFHSWSGSLKTARYFKGECGRYGNLLMIDSPVRSLSLEDIITARMQITGESLYATQSEVFVLDEDAVRFAKDMEDDSEADRIHNSPA